ncbi:Protein of unknown function [Pseudonocardia thermophila]|jgi:Domain of unknown function (DUF1994).|uniref:GmrSD restriction endonucleases C-terminal domain-containing protein n=1 Tax=Pseudonocardia thermophila TaxID=1848 RepID=A0A1M6ZQE3_PSETH|nr:HNH endonuclease family protein [Pseudonocardia thermophila]SHL32691.1 Protein of unknown function [Pseudonocardia thermophila]
MRVWKRVLIGVGVAVALLAVIMVVPLPPAAEAAISPARWMPWLDRSSAAPTPTSTPTSTPTPTPTNKPGLTVFPTPFPTPLPTPTGQPKPLARDALAALPVKGRAPRTGYSRDLFGAAWTDIDRNGCDQRNDILRRDLVGVVTMPGTRDCVVKSGILYDRYTGRTISFERGPRSAEVQIDHIVALSDAWQKGAQQLSPEQRLSLANDPLNLVAVDGPTNQGKGDSDAASWLPPNKVARCWYVARQIAVKQRYQLWVTTAERAAMEEVLATCPAEPLPS